MFPLLFRLPAGGFGSPENFFPRQVEAVRRATAGRGDVSSGASWAWGTSRARARSLSWPRGANALLVPGRLDIGAVYTTASASQCNLDVNGLIVKVTLRH